MDKSQKESFNNLFFPILNGGNLGYSNQAKALAHLLAENEKAKINKTIDLKNKTTEVAVIELLNSLKSLKEEKEIKKITLVSSGSFGLPFFNTFAKKLEEEKLSITVEYQYTTDRYFKIPEDLEDSSWIKNLYITCIDGIEEFKNCFKDFKNKPITLKTDLVQVDPENIQQQSKDFKTKNSVVCKEIEEFEYLKNGIAFIGGRVQNSNGSWTENESKVFANTARHLMNQGVRVFATHGLRSFTKSDKTNDFEAINAFYQAIFDELKEGESTYIFAQEGNDGEETRKPVLKKITKQTGKTIDECSENINMTGNFYNYLLCLAGDQKLAIYPTIEQTTLPSEAVAVGVDPTKIIPLGREQGWSLFVESNYVAYKYFTTKQQKLVVGEHTKNLVEPLTPFDAIIQFKKTKSNEINK